jgi:MtN3 and saliva related transmembrane protein
LPSRKFSPALDPSKAAFPDYNQIMNLEYHHIEIIGYCAAFLTTVAFLPQAIQSWRTKDLSGISLGMYSLFTAGVGLWLVYGLIIEKWPLILANALTFTLALSILLLKIRYSSKRRKSSSLKR